MRKYAPSMTIALVIALLWLLLGGRGADRHMDLQDSRLTFFAGSERTGEDYGVMNEGPALTLRSGWYTLHYEIETDGESVIRLTTTNSAGLTPSVIPIGPDSGTGTVRVHALDELYNLQILVDYQSGSSLRVVDIDWVGDACTDRLFTLSFALAAVAVLLALHRSGWLTPRRRTELVVLAGAVLIASIPNLKENLSAGHDFIFHIDRLLNLINALRSGQFPARLGAYICSRYGAPTSVFYPELFLYLPAGMMLAGASAIYAVHALLIAMQAATALIMRYSAGRLFRSPTAGTVSAVLYTLSIYRLTDVYTRFALGEALAMCFVPLFVYALVETALGERRRPLLLALSAAAIYQSHVLSAAVCLAASAGLCAVCIVPIVRGRRLLPVLGAGALALMLCAWTLLPMATFSAQGMSTDALVRRPQEHAIAPAQLLLDASSADGELDDETLSAYGVTLGLPLVLGALAALCAACEGRSREDRLGLLFTLGGAGFALMATTLFPWARLNALTGGAVGYIQFPWRMLMPASVLLAFAGGHGIARLMDGRRAAFAALALCAVAALPMLTAYTRMNGFSIPSRLIGWGDNFEDYILRGSSAQTMKDASVHADAGIAVTQYEKAGTQITAHVRAQADGVVAFPLFGYAGYAATLDGEPVEVYAGEENRLSIRLAQGDEGALRIWFAGVALWRAGDALSLGTALALACAGIRRRRAQSASDRRARSLDAAASMHYNKEDPR